MWRAGGWRVVVVVVCVWVAVSSTAAPPAEPAPAPAKVPASDEACKTACNATIARCAGVFGPSMGDMRPFCEQAVVRRCHAMGLKVCEAPVAEPGSGH